jgi:hypothetical protein
MEKNKACYCSGSRTQTHRKLLLGETEVHNSCGEKSRGDAFFGPESYGQKSEAKKIHG